MTALNEAGKGKIVFGFAMLLLVATVQDFLTALPDRSADQRLMSSLIDLASIREFASVDEFSQRLVKRSRRNLVFAPPEPKPLLIGFLGKILDRVFPRCKPSEQVRDDGPWNRVRRDDPLPIRTHRVDVAERRE